MSLILNSLLNNKIYQLEFTRGSMFFFEYSYFEVYDKIRINNIEIIFSEYVDDKDDAYNKIIFSEGLIDKNRGTSNNGIGKFFIGHKSLNKFNFFGYTNGSENTEHILVLNFDDNTRLLIDASIPFGCSLYFNEINIIDILKNPKLKESTR